jgi:hypothetical protein
LYGIDSLGNAQGFFEVFVRIEAVVLGQFGVVQSGFEGTGLVVARGLLVALVGVQQFLRSTAKMVAHVLHISRFDEFVFVAHGLSLLVWVTVFKWVFVRSL